jgi:hypothetical protein
VLEPISQTRPAKNGLNEWILDFFIETLTNFEVRDAALIKKNLHCASEATAFASIVLPVPGGPNRSIPISTLI